MGHATPHFLSVLLALGMLTSAHAQTAIPIDSAVQDADPLARSLRQVPLGLRTTGEHTSVFAVPVDPAAAPWEQPTGLYQPYGQNRFTYYRIGPGFRVRMDRVDYLVRFGEKDLAMDIKPRYDGEFIEMMGPNAVFDLRPQWPNAPQASWMVQPIAPMDQPLVNIPPASFSISQDAAIPGARRIEAPAAQPIDARVNGLIDGRVH